MNDLVQSLIKIGAPLLGGLVGGPMGAAVIGALADALGTAATPEATAQAIQNNPAAAGVVLKLEADKGPEFLAELNARLADVQDARATTVKLVEAGSAIAWGPVLISVMIVAGFLGMAVLLMFRQVPDSQLAIVVFTTLSTGFGAVMNYWLGSSAGSANKDATLKQIATQAGTPSVGQMAGKVLDAAVKTATKR